MIRFHGQAILKAVQDGLADPNPPDAPPELGVAEMCRLEALRHQCWAHLWRTSLEKEVSVSLLMDFVRLRADVVV
jgi:hypothetical protein